MLEVHRGFSVTFSEQPLRRGSKPLSTQEVLPGGKKNFGFKLPVEDLLGISTSDLAEVC